MRSKTKLIYRVLTSYILFFFFFLPVAVNAEEANNADENPIVVCIDPGHGGENLGAEWDVYTEKEMTLKVAYAMKDELEKYNGIKVIMTRTDDEDISLGDRVRYAKDNGADFFFCLHFNMSENHELYGTENWISAFGKQYARGMDFAKIEMGLLTNLGLYDRGIKTRIGKTGKNYYGVLRVCDEESIPGIIIEHCHLDNVNDEPFYDNDSWLDKYGRLDATAVAMYYGLYSPEGENDFRNYTYEATPIPDSVVKPDTTEPEVCNVSVGDITESEDGPFVMATITATDTDCRMLYYKYSIDGGDTFTERFKWQGVDGETGDTITAKINLPYDTGINLVVNSYNLFDLEKLSNVVSISAIDSPKEEAIEETIPADDTSEYTTINRFEKSQDENENIDSLPVDKQMLIIFVIAALVILIILIIIGLITYERFH